RLRKEDGSLSEIIVGTHIDITEIKNKEEKIKYLNYHDQLTGVFNRRYYEETIGKLINPGNLPLAIIMADVNGLKLTNDAFGHLSGDKLLTRVAEIIESEARPHDIVARIGGDEFVVLMPRANSIDAENTVKRINESIQDFKVDNIVISVSFGWATKKDDDEDFTEVYKRAEYRMYRNKLSERSSKRSQSIRIIFKTLQEKSEQEKLHSERVSYYCSQLAKQMQLSFNEISEVETAGLMHDIGKIGIDEQVLNKTEKFTDSDWRAMKKHSEIGYRILSSANEFNVIADYVLYHHERWDGKGYPRGLKGESIPVASRILSIADSYDAMVSERCYKKALSKEVAAAEIINSAGTQFDPDIAAIFVEKVLKIKVSDLPIE
ncbi:MAG: diguanylate cyclase, partial [Clostridia bacterium]|nr:diguanylate cyclase [Clostridia bacterium]